MFWESGKEEGGGEKIVKRILLVLTVALVMAAMLVVTIVPAFAAPPSREHPGKGHPVVNAAGKCPNRLNRDTSPGGLKKCD